MLLSSKMVFSLKNMYPLYFNNLFYTTEEAFSNEDVGSHIAASEQEIEAVSDAESEKEKYLVATLDQIGITLLRHSIAKLIKDTEHLNLEKSLDLYYENADEYRNIYIYIYVSTFQLNIDLFLFSSSP